MITGVNMPHMGARQHQKSTASHLLHSDMLLLQAASSPTKIDESRACSGGSVTTGLLALLHGQNSARGQ